MMLQQEYILLTPVMDQAKPFPVYRRPTYPPAKVRFAEKAESAIKNPLLRTAMSYNHRPLSPGGKRVQTQGRLSDAAVTDPYYHQPRPNSYVAPRTSGVIPISTQTFVNIPPPASTRTSERYDSYTGRPRRSSLVDTSRGVAASTSQLPSRTRPTIIQQEIPRPASPGRSSRDREYNVTPASSQDSWSTPTHRKLYSVDAGTAKLVADVDVPAGSERYPKQRRDSVERSYRPGTERESGRRGYHPSSSQNRTRQKSIDDEDAYSYTDPASMYSQTEPSWRETRDPRPRRSSIDRTGPVTRERPVSVIDPTFGIGTGVRSGAKETGPPPSTRGWDKINDLGRTRAVRDEPRQVARSPTRGGTYLEPESYADSRDPHSAPSRARSTDRRSAFPKYDAYDYDDRRDPRRSERRHSVAREPRADQSVERRGFGIRADVRNESLSRYASRDDRESDESFERLRTRRETGPGVYVSDSSRTEQERKDREMAQRLQTEEFSRTRERGHSDARDYSREPRWRDDDRIYPSEQDRRDRDRERERHQRRDTDRDRDRDYSRRDDSPRESADSQSKSSLGQAATGSLAGAAAALGLSGLLNKVSEKREKDKDDQQERERDERRDDDGDYVRDRRSGAAGSDEPPRERREERDRQKERDRGTSYEASPEPSRGAPPVIADKPQDKQVQDRPAERERDHARSAEVPALDADEDYRRRMEKVQRELGLSAEDQRGYDSDQDRERRRREREQRQREREQRNGGTPSNGAIGPPPGGVVEMPPFPSDPSLEYSAIAGAQSMRNSNMEGSATGSSPPPSTLQRKPSILDRPMTDEPAEIIDNSLSERRENRVRIVDPPSEEEDRKPRGILKKPTEKFPEDPNAVREGVAPLKDATKKGIPPGARWTKIDRRLVNPEALEQAHERFEERLDCVIVLRVLTKEEIQKLADKTREIRDRRYEEEREENKNSRHSRRDRTHDRRDRDEYEYSDSENEFKEKAPKMLEAPSTTGSSSNADFVRDNRDRRHEREAESAYSMSGGLGRREDSQGRY